MSIENAGRRGRPASAGSRRPKPPAAAPFVVAIVGPAGSGKSTYGADVYRADGTLDRARVGARVFSDPAALARLNALVHPRIVARLRDDVTHATGVDTVVVDAALLLDWGFERECDAVVAVVAPREQQIARLRRARGWSEEEATRRLASARSNEAFRALADEVVVNDADPAAAERAMRGAVDRLRARWTAR
jgi:dephospho-CoA kinase